MEATQAALATFWPFLAGNENYQRLQRLEQQLANDPLIQRDQAQFNAAREQFASAQQYGKYHPDYQTYQQALMNAKIQLESHPSVREYKQAHKAVQALLNQMSILLGKRVSEHLVVPSDYFGAVVSPTKSCHSGSCNCGGK